jgi:Flp pilus assembly protein TadD
MNPMYVDTFNDKQLLDQLNRRKLAATVLQQLQASLRLLNQSIGNKDAQQVYTTCKTIDALGHSTYLLIPLKLCLFYQDSAIRLCGISGMRWITSYDDEFLVNGRPPLWHAVQFLCSAVQQSSETVVNRKAALLSLGEMNFSNLSRSTIEQCLVDSEPEIRATAIHAYGDQVRRSNEAYSVQVIVRALRDADSSVRKQAIYASVKSNALECIGQLIDLQSNPNESPEIRAQTQVAVNTILSEAETAYRKAATAESKNPEAYAGLGEVLAMQSRYAEARVQYEKAIGLSPRNGTYRADLAAIYHGLGLTDLALREATQARRLGCRQHFVYQLLGMH